jgi:hypothetical protein
VKIAHGVLILICLALLFVGFAGVILTHAQVIQTKTGNYQLDTGDTVTWWLDEERALLCEMIPHTGLSCLPLTSSSYAWPALPAEK